MLVDNIALSADESVRCCHDLYASTQVDPYVCWRGNGYHLHVAAITTPSRISEYYVRACGGESQGTMAPEVEGHDETHFDHDVHIRCY